MNKVYISSLMFARSIYSRANNSVRRTSKILKKDTNKELKDTNTDHNGLPLDISHQAASDLIRTKLLDSKPCMISRLGAVELKALVNYLNIHREPEFLFEKQISYITEETQPFWWSDRNKFTIKNNAGFFPTTDEYLDKFALRYIKDIKNIDILGSWLKEELIIKNMLNHVTVMRLRDLRPWEHLNPWSEVLHNKTVLVIHPFDVSIQNQYSRRELLFKDKRVLPRFELKTLKAVQSRAGNKTQFDNWFDALDWMCEKISNIQFDIAIIGAGAYGLPLASFVKEMGKKSVHLGGVTQLLFGIKGKRWEQRQEYQNVFNEYWVRPLPSESPGGSQSFSHGLSYW